MSRPVVRLRIDFAPGSALGPGKVGLLEAVDRTGSLSAAAAELGIGYKRAWSLLQSVNELFEAPLVVMSRGGRGGGGATVTERGREVITAFRSVERRASLAATQAFAGFAAVTRPRRKGAVKGLSARTLARRRSAAN